MITEIFKTLNAGVSEKKSIVLSNNGGIIIMDVDESKFTSEMKKQLDHVDFNFYLNDSTSEPKRLLLSTKSWRSHEDRAIAFNEVPAATFIEVVVVLNESYIAANNVIPIQEFPIKVSISDENILRKSGGGGGVDPTLIDDKISAHNTSPTAHEDIRQLVSKAVKYKGSVKNYSDLPVNPVDGDMYNIENADTEHQINAGDNVVWIADTKTWDNLGGFIDLSQLQVMMDFPAWLSAVADDPTKTMDDVVTVLDTNLTTTGLIYMGVLSVADLPDNGMMQAEVVIEVLKSDNGDPLYKFTLVSTNVSPYLWTATGYNGGFGGWQARPTEEDLLEYVKFTDYATPDREGVVRVSSNLGTAVSATNVLYIVSAQQSEISARSADSKPIVPKNLNFAVKSALSDANRINDMTDEEKTNARGVIGALGETDLSSYVKNTDYATKSKGGVVRIGDQTAVGLAINATGAIYIVTATSGQIDTRTNSYNPITPSNLDYAVRSVIPEVQTSLPETIIKNCIYDLGEQTSLSITLPATGNVGDWLQFDFMSGATATTLTITSTSGLLGYDLTPEINMIYSLYLDWGIIGKTNDTMNYGWRFSYVEYPISNN